MPLTLAQMHALIADGGNNTAEDVRDVIEALYDWIPADQKYRRGLLAGESVHASSDFFTSYSGYTEQTVTGTATWAANRSGLGVKFSGQSANDLAATLKAVPSGPPLTIETSWANITDESSNPGMGLLLTDGTATTSNIAAFGELSAFGALRGTGTLTSVTANVAHNNIERERAHQGRLFFRLIWKSANTFAIAVSVDTVNWIDLDASDFTPTITPTHMGLFVTSWSQSKTFTATFDYLRVYEADLSV